MRYLFLLAALLLGCSGVYTEGTPGTPGEKGDPGAPGMPGPPGPPGAAFCVDGERLKCVWIEGADGSSQLAPEMWDSSEDDPAGRDEYCTWRLYEGKRLCLPPILNATEWYAWPDPGCAHWSDRVFEKSFAPASYPDGTSVVKTEPFDGNGWVKMRSEPVTTYYTKSNGGTGPCVEASAASGPYKDPWLWTLWDENAFVSGALAP